MMQFDFRCGMDLASGTEHFTKLGVLRIADSDPNSVYSVYMDVLDIAKRFVQEYYIQEAEGHGFMVDIPRETLNKARLTALHAICLQIFRHIAQKSLAIH